MPKHNFHHRNNKKKDGNAFFKMDKKKALKMKKNKTINRIQVTWKKNVSHN